MERSSYLETLEGQLHERSKRRLNVHFLSIHQEPQGKGSLSSAEKLFFRESICKQLESRNQRAHNGDIVLEIDFYVTKDNPPALHSLPKNYLDLLHKEMPDIDNRKRLLFKDDSQIKILIANYHLNTFGGQSPEILIKSYALSSFVKDIELVERIIHNKFGDANRYDFDWLQEERRLASNLRYDRDCSEELILLEKNKQTIIQEKGQLLFELERNYLARQVQERYLRMNEIQNTDLISIFQHLFSYNKKYSRDMQFQRLWELSRNLIYFSASFLDLGAAPRQKGDSKVLRKLAQEKLNSFKEKHKILFPLLQPINVTVMFVPPVNMVIDLDNLARHIMPFIVEVFRPPSISVFVGPQVPKESLKEILTQEGGKASKIPPYSIAGYQLIELPRRPGDPLDGRIDFAITDGFLFKSNVWRMVDDIIDKWEDCI